MEYRKAQTVQQTMAKVEDLVVGLRKLAREAQERADEYREAGKGGAWTARMEGKADAWALAAEWIEDCYTARPRH